MLNYLTLQLIDERVQSSVIQAILESMDETHKTILENFQSTYNSMVNTSATGEGFFATCASDVQNGYALEIQLQVFDRYRRILKLKPQTAFVEAVDTPEIVENLGKILDSMKDDMLPPTKGTLYGDTLVRYQEEMRAIQKINKNMTLGLVSALRILEGHKETA